MKQLVELNDQSFEIHADGRVYRRHVRYIPRKGREEIQLRRVTHPGVIHAVKQKHLRDLQEKRRNREELERMTQTEEGPAEETSLLGRLTYPFRWVRELARAIRLDCRAGPKKWARQATRWARLAS